MSNQQTTFTGEQVERAIPDQPETTVSSSEIPSYSSLTEHHQIGVAMETIIKAHLCSGCKSRLLMLMAQDIKRLELRRANLSGQIEGIDCALGGDEECANAK